MANKTGDAVSLTLNGTRFACAKDIEPLVDKGGRKITESQGYGDGTSDGYVGVVVPSISGLKVKVSEENRDAFEAALGNPAMPIVYETVGSTYELTGYIAGEVKVSTTKKLSDEFTVYATDGSIRES